jgi:thioredoxin reductase/Pyruvate/2-oxoacid:ferredoxin oxidoreductase delta subunit
MYGARRRAREPDGGAILLGPVSLIEQPVLLIYAAPLLAAWLLYLYRHRRRHRISAQQRDAAIAAGLSEPASLHPVIDPARCLGSRACMRACPEGDVIGFIDGKAELINPTHCIGHGACRAACPMDAIQLVFGTATRGVDIPTVSPEFETNVPGIFIAGELGGMGLIRNAVEQGRQAMDTIVRRRSGGAEGYDVVIVGAGPAGIAATLAAHEAGLRYATVEQESLGGTVAQYPRGKIVMTAPVELPLIGKVRLRETSKEALLRFWQDVVQRSGVRIRYGERVDGISAAANGAFEVTTAVRAYRTQTVLLAVGRRGTPRKLDVPGEELPKVVYRLIDPEQYRGQRVLVVGGGDSALEAAATLAEDEQSDVTLSYRSDAFGRAKLKNRERIEAAQRSGRLRLILKSNVLRIEPQRVVLEQDGRNIEVANDAVLVSVGGVLPTAFLKSIGIEVQTKFGTA